MLLLSQSCALVALLIAVAAGAPTGHDSAATLWALGAEGLGLIGLTAFYRALSIGTMSIVAPISATGVAIPVLVGIASGERPAALQAAGILLACAGVVLATRNPQAADEAARRSDRRAVVLALVAAIGFGSFFAGIDRAEETGDVTWILLVTRLEAVAILLAAAAAIRPRLPSSPPALGLIAAIGLFDLLANLLFVLAAGRGLLSVVGVLGSLYPAVTVVLARLVLHERLTRRAGRRRAGHARGRRGPGGRVSAGARAPRPAATATGRLLSGCMSVLRSLLIALLAALLVPAAAAASSDQVMTFEAPSQLLDDGAREPTLDEIQGFGVTRVRALVYWVDFSARRNSRRRPRFDRADHTAYPARHVGSARPAGRVDRAPRHGAAPHAHGPGARRGRRKRRRGHIDDPNPAEFGRWARAVATRYGDRVDLWSIWNEPNHPDFLGPQYRRGRPHTPRALPPALPAGRGGDPRRRRGQRATSCCSARRPRSATRTSSPRWASCAGRCASTRTTRKRQGCSRLRIDGYAHHAYTRRSGPTFVSEDTDEVSIGSLSRLVSALDTRGGRARHRADRAIYLTEFGIQSKPDPLAGVSLAAPGRVPRHLRAHRLRQPAREGVLAVPDARRPAAPRPAAAALLGLRDRPAHQPRAGQKPSYDGFMLPLAVTQYGSSDVALGPRAAGHRADGGHDPAQRPRSAAGGA